MNEEDLLIIGAGVIKKAQAQGAQFSETYLIKGTQLIIELEESSIVKANQKSISGVGLRVIVNQAVGLASSTQFSSPLLDGMINDAISLAHISNPDSNIVGLAEETDSYPIVEGLFDKELANAESGSLVEFAVRGLNASLERDSSINVGGSLGVTIRNIAIVNSNGIMVESPQTSLYLYLDNKITKGNDTGADYEIIFGRSLSDINPEDVGRTATDKAFRMLGAQKIDSGNYPFLLAERASRMTINSILSQGISALEIDRGTAYFKDRLNDKIASSSLSVIDNPLERGGLKSRSFDDEGTPHNKLVLVEDGVLSTYISDVYTSHKLDIPNTGSASKDGYVGIPRPDITQIQIKAGDASEEELFEELGTGLYIENSLSPGAGTNISQQVNVGFWVENGEIQFPVRNTMLGTTVYDLFQNIRLVGKKLWWDAGYKSPKILFAPIKFSGGRT